MMVPTKILCVDDSASYRAAVRLSLKKKLNVSLSVFSLPEEAYEEAVRSSLNNSPFDFFIFDIEMPQLDGIELLTRLRRFPSYRNTPAVFLTATLKAEKIEAAGKIGDLVISKNEVDVMQQRVAAAVDDLLLAKAC